MLDFDNSNYLNGINILPVYYNDPATVRDCYGASCSHCSCCFQETSMTIYQQRSYIQCSYILILTTIATRQQPRKGKATFPVNSLLNYHADCQNWRLKEERDSKMQYEVKTSDKRPPMKVACSNDMWHHSKQWLSDRLKMCCY